jgi:hypothetical protein
VTRREITRRAFDAKHKRLLLRLRAAPKGQMAARRAELVAYVATLLRAAP